MNKFILTAILLLVSIPILAQNNIVLKSDYLSSITKIKDDAAGNLYITGSFKGTCYFGNRELNAPRGTKYLAKLSNSGVFEWVIEYPTYIWDYVVVDSVVKVLVKERVKDPQHRAESQILYIESLSASSGGQISRVKVAELDGEYFNILLQGYFAPNGSLATISTWKKDKRTVFNGKELTKDLYSGGHVAFFDQAYAEKWSFTFSGGTDGFTNIRTEAVHVNNDEEVFVVTYFGKDLHLGDKTYSTSEVQKEKGLMTLYDNAIVLFKVKDGALKQETRLGDYSISTEYMDEDGDGNLYITGYFSGNEKHSADGIPPGFYKNALLNGEKLQSTQINKGTNQPSEASFLVSLDPEFNTNWTQILDGISYVRPRSLSVKENIGLTVMFMDRLNAGGKTYDAHVNNNSGSDSYLGVYDKAGNVKSSSVFTGPDNDWVYILYAKEPIIYGSIDNKVKVADSEVSAGGSKQGVGFLSSSIRLSSDVSDNASKFSVGDRISGNWKGEGRYYPGKITRIDGDKYYIEYDDGDVEWTTREHLRK